MQKFRLTFTFLCLIVAMGICLSGCTKPVPKVEDLKGKWVAIKKENYKLGGWHQVGFIIEFYDDKSIMLPSGKGTWSILPDGQVKIDILGMTMHGVLDKEQLIITMPKQNGKVIFKRL